MKRNKSFKKIICLMLLATVIVISVIPSQVKAAGDGPSYSTRKVIQWKRVLSYNDLPNDTASKYYMLLAWTSNNKDPNEYAPNDLSWYCMTENTGHYDSGTDALIGSQMATTFYGNIFPVNRNEFITASPYGMPQIIFAGLDGKNNDCPSYIIRLNEGKGKYVLEDGSSNFKFRDSGSDCWGIAVREPGDKDIEKYEASAKYDGTVCLYYNRENDRDSGFKFHTEKIVCPKDKDYGDFDPFVMWVGTEKEYSCINSDYSVMPGEVLDIKNDGIVVENGVTLTVYPGGTLSVSGTCINNGQILNYGTMIIQKNGALFPMTKPSSKVDTSIFDVTSNQVKCVGGKTSVSVPGYRKKIACEGIFLNFGAVGFSKEMGSFFLTEGSAMDNYGVLITGKDLYIYDSSLKNYGAAWIGFDMKNLAAIKGLSPSLPLPPTSTIDENTLNFHVLGKSVVKTFGNARASVCGNSVLTRTYFSEE